MMLSISSVVAEGMGNILHWYTTKTLGSVTRHPTDTAIRRGVVYLLIIHTWVVVLGSVYMRSGGPSG